MHYIAVAVSHSSMPLHHGYSLWNQEEDLIDRKEQLMVNIKSWDLNPCERINSSMRFEFKFCCFKHCD